MLVNYIHVFMVNFNIKKTHSECPIFPLKLHTDSSAYLFEFLNILCVV